MKTFEEHEKFKNVYLLYYDNHKRFWIDYNYFKQFNLSLEELRNKFLECLQELSFICYNKIY